MIDEIGEQLAGWGKVVTVETRGRVTGRPSEVAVGYLEGADGTVLVYAPAVQTEGKSWQRGR